MNISGLIKTFIGDTQAAEPKKLELKTGEVVKGVVQQILPDDEAMLNIGGVQVRAKLETPLKQGEVTLLQVQPESSSGQIVLKPLDASVVQIADSSLSDILKQVSLADTTANRQLVQTLHQAGIPLTKDTVQAFVQLQSQMPSSLKQEDWLPSAIVAFQKGVPLTQESVMSVKQAMTGPAFHETLQQLELQISDALTGEAPLSVSTKAAMDAFKQVLSVMKESSGQVIRVPEGSTTTTEAFKATEGQVVDSVNDNSLEGRSGRPAAILGNAVMSDSGKSSGMMGMNGMKGNLVPSSAESLQNLPLSTSDEAPVAEVQVSKTGKEGTNPIAAKDNGGGQVGSSKSSVDFSASQQGGSPNTTALQSKAPGVQVAFTDASVTETPAGIIPNGKAPIEGKLPQTQAHLTTGTLTPTAQGVSSDGLLTKDSSAAVNTPTEASVSKDTDTVQKHAVSTTSNAQDEVQSFSSNKAAGNEHWISRLIKALGVEHEHQLFKLPETGVKGMQQSSGDALFSQLQLNASSQEQEPLKMTDTLKSALLQLIQADDIPSGLKDMAKQAVQQITGQQLLLNSDKVSMFTHVTLFVPLLNANGEQTAAVHIQSRKGKRGEIDAQNCRLVFDLQMKTLGNTMVDVQVVDRIVSLQVHNDQPYIQQLLESYREDIAASLSGIGYQFISLKCSPYPERGQDSMLPVSSNKQEVAAAMNLQSIYGSKPYRGMDVRV